MAGYASTLYPWTPFWFGLFLMDLTSRGNGLSMAKHHRGNAISYNGQEPSSDQDVK